MATPQFARLHDSLGLRDAVPVRPYKSDYIDVANRPVAAHEHVQEILNWINRLALAIPIRDRIPTVELRAHIDDQLEAARNI